MARLSGKTEKPKTDFDLAICGWCAGTGEMQNRSECPKCKGHGSKVIEKPFDDLRPIKLPETPGTIPFVDRDKPKRELGPGNLCPKCLVKMDAEGWCGCDPTKA
jgi:RecJ-like exonuclease